MVVYLFCCNRRKFKRVLLAFYVSILSPYSALFFFVLRSLAAFFCSSIAWSCFPQRFIFLSHAVSSFLFGNLSCIFMEFIPF